MADTDFSRFVPGFDFLQGLMKNAGAAIPGFNQWVAPTLDPHELDKRIDELRTVQFWLEQNARMLAATIQALEVQRMTLSTLHAMNVPMADLKEVLKTPMGAARPAAAAPTAPAAPAPPRDAAPDKAAAPAAAEPAPSPSPSPAPKAGTPEAPAGAASKGPVGADPMQWWNALTQQFTQVAANAMKTAQTTAAAATSAATSAAAAAARASASAPASTAPAGAKPAPRASAKPGAKRAAKPAAPPTAAPAAKSTAARKAPARRKTS
jgi:hypothetical protein